MKKRFAAASLAAMMVLSMTACGGGNTATTAAPAETKAEAAAEGEIPAPEGDDNKISIGVTPVPHAEIVNDVLLRKLRKITPVP